MIYFNKHAEFTTGSGMLMKINNRILSSFFYIHTINEINNDCMTFAKTEPHYAYTLYAY